MNLYLSGPITGIPNLNKEAFSSAAAALRAAGHQVINPHEIGQPSELLLPWADYLRADLLAMLHDAQAVALLPHWTDSRGARLEWHIANALGWEAKPWKDWIPTTSSSNSL